jgi:hypothetical protein
MANTTSKRVSIKQYQVAYLESFAAEIGTDDLSEILNWVLTDYRRIKQGAVQPQQSQVIPFPQQPQPRTTSTDDDLAEALLAAI